MTYAPPGMILPQPRPTPAIVGDMDFWSDVFPEAMRRLKEGPLPYNGPPQWGIRHLSIWPDVQAKLDMARRDYDHFNGQQNIGRFRRKLRGAMDKAAVPLQQGMKLVPDLEIVSPVVGAIDLILDAYRQAATVRETVNSGFDDLPETFIRMDFYLKSYPKDHNILGASVELVLAIFRAIEEAVRFYTSAQAKHAGLAILTGEEYQQKLLRSLKEIRVCSEKLEARASLSFAHRVISDNWVTHQVLGAILHVQLEGNSQTAGIAKLLTRLLGVLGDRENNWIPSTPAPMYPNVPWIDPLLPSPTLGPREWTKTQLLSHLATPPRFDEGDLQDAIRNPGDITLEDRQHADQLTYTREFLDWMRCPGSYRLLVHGNFSSTDVVDRRVTPLSVVCAVTALSLRVKPSGRDGLRISLVFFCGVHRSNDALSGGVAMIRSLSQQLLAQAPYPTFWLDPQLDIQRLEHGDVEDLCLLFKSLMYGLPAGVKVFCIIDSGQEYESPEHLPEMMTIVRTLLTLATECNSRLRGVFKLLLVSPDPDADGI
ncbi:hypothetical protein PG984_005066 [Apiospora sp. TS-2023a]